MINLEDLINLENGKTIDIKEDESVNKVLEMVKDDVEDFVNRKEVKKIDKTKVLENSKLGRKISKIVSKSGIANQTFKAKLQAEFDKKMHRIKRIKSASFRKAKKQQELKNNLYEELNSTSTISEEEQEYVPLISINNSKIKIKKEINKELVSDESNQDFYKEKQEIVNREAPREDIKVLPGWNSWAGPGLKVKRTKYNTIRNEIKGIEISKRSDFQKSNLIINENVKYDLKYKCDNLKSEPSDYKTMKLKLKNNKVNGLDYDVKEYES
ncbi:hypothetical protein A0H76_956 [Hepatospora eriocheir]|uniref:Uncharacterized protein n=1 Tax=Hepatospora eriocheir TaxID=1081669 RepID=A0A1X0QI83_9MICR|nr:hypothetical protein A0H76_956 [Hepatospora eriocheir]